MTSAVMTAPVGAGGDFGRLLREWRTRRRFSQLDLALEANVSSRHISFLETGRSRPSRAMVLQIARALDVPLRGCNMLMTAAGFTSAYRETALEDPDIAEALDAVRFLLSQLEPCPALVLDRLYRVRMGNDAANRLLTWLGGSAIDASAPAPDGITVLQAMRPVIANWEAVAVETIVRIRRAAAAAPGDGELAALRDRIDGDPELSGLFAQHGLETPLSPLVPVIFRKDGVELTFITTIATFGTPQDVTLQELKIETFFPGNVATRGWLGSGSPD